MMENNYDADIQSEADQFFLREDIVSEDTITGKLHDIDIRSRNLIVMTNDVRRAGVSEVI